MAILNRARSCWRHLMRRPDVERELDAELQATLEILVDEKVASGMPRWQARRAAMIELGGIEPLKERVRDVRAGMLIETLLQDLRYALRHLRRSPGFTAAAILTLAFGIGANTAMFTVLNALVLQRLPIKDPDGLISVTSRDARGRVRYIPFPAVHVLAREGPLQDVCGHNGGAIVPIEANGVATQAMVAFVSGQCFKTFGVMPILGRPMTDDDAPLVSAGNRVVLISHRFWIRMYAADPGAIGKAIRADGVDASIIGVLPKGFGGLHVDTGVDVFAPPDTLIPARADRRPVINEMLGRLRPGVTLQQAQAEMSVRWPALLKASVPATSNPLEGADLWGAALHLEPIGTGISGYRDRYAPALKLILGLTALLLLLACINLGGLLLTRLMARGTELAVRLALGGTRRRIAQQMLVESLMLSLSGAALAVPLSFAFIAPLVSSIPVGLVERTVAFTPDLLVLMVTTLVGLAVGIAMTALPLWVAMRRNASTRFTWDRTIAGSTSRWARGLLVAQVALSVMMVIGAGLLIRSLYLLQQADLGVRTAGILTVRTMSMPNGYRGLDAESYYPALLQQVAALPGVVSAGFSRSFPRAFGDATTAVAFVGEAPGDARAMPDTVSPEFFETLGIPLLEGRLPSWADTTRTRKVAVVSESLARALAPGGIAVLLALIGVHGTLAYSVSRRTREIGVRVAIGAAPGAVARSVLREAFLVTVAGVAIGLPLAYLAAGTLRTLMFGISEADPFTFAGAAVFFVALGLAAGVIPARRAARVDPLIALRAE